jgi:mannose-6-phosphate isomerase-like protein (cupin superfamily)
MKKENKMSEKSNSSSSNDKRPFLKRLPLDETDYFEILGKADAERLRSGLVTLLPGKDVGWHNTEKYEEMLIVLNGCGKLLSRGYADLDIAYGQVAYNPPHTEHNVINNGLEPLRYIYIVTPV